MWLGIGKIILPSIRAELEDPEDVVGENPSVVVVHGQPQGAARLVVRCVHHQELKEAKTLYPMIGTADVALLTIYSTKR